MRTLISYLKQGAQSVLDLAVIVVGTILLITAMVIPIAIVAGITYQVLKLVLG